MPSIAALYTKRPLLCFFFTTILFCFLASVSFFFDLSIDYSLSSFGATGIEPVRLGVAWSAGTAANTGLRPYLYRDEFASLPGAVDDATDRQGSRKRQAASKERRSRKYQFSLVFQSASGKSILTPTAVSRFRAAEQLIVDTAPLYESVCHLTYDTVCSRPLSLLNYYYWSCSQDSCVADGSAVDQTPSFDAATAAALRHGVYAFTDGNFSKDSPTSAIFRIEFALGSPVNSGLREERDEPDIDVVHRWFIESGVPALEAAGAVGCAGDDDCIFFYGGGALTDAIIVDTVWGDLYLSIGAFFIIGIVMAILMRSAFLGVAGLVEVLVSFPVAFSAYRVVGIDSVGILNVAAIFLAIGIACDDIFVFASAFAQAHVASSEPRRVAYTLAVAGRATFVTSVTTAAAFSVNCFSPIPALQHFGVYMVLLVVFNYIMVCVWFPSVLVLYARHVAASEARLGARLGLTAAYDALASRISLVLHSSQRVGTTSRFAGLATGAGPGDRCCYFVASKWLERFGKYAIVTLSALVIVSVGLTSQLSMSTEMPQLFDPSSPVQRWIDYSLTGFETSASSYLRSGIVAGCDGVFGSNTVVDECGVCGGPGPPCAATTTDAATSAGIPMSTTTTTTTTMTLTTTAATAATTTTTTATAIASTAGSSTSTTTANMVTPSPTVLVGSPTPAPSTSPPGTPLPTASPTVAGDTPAPTPAVDTPAPSPAPPVQPMPPPVAPPPTAGPAGPPPPPPVPTFAPAACADGETVDLCGVCGGSSDCVPDAPVSSNAVPVFIVWGIDDVDDGQVGRFRSPDGAEVGVVEYARVDSWTSMLDSMLEQFDTIHDAANPTNRSERLFEEDGERWVLDGLRTSLSQYRWPPSEVEFPQLLVRYLAEAARFRDDVLFSSDILDSRYPAAPAQYQAVPPTDLKVRAIRGALVSRDLTHGTPAYDAVVAHDNIETVVESVADDTPVPPGQTSNVYMRVFTEVHAIDSLTYSVVVATLVSLVLIICFTGNLIVSLLAIVAGLLSSTLVTFGTFYAIGWTVGAVEAIGISVVLGFSIDYFFHLADAYAEAPSPHRIDRTRIALGKMGIPVLSGAVTTIFACSLLLGAEVAVFRQFGQVIVIAGCVAILYCYLFFVPILQLIGPRGDACTFRICRPTRGKEAAGAAGAGSSSGTSTSLWDDDFADIVPGGTDDQHELERPGRRTAESAGARRGRAGGERTAGSISGKTQAATTTLSEGPLGERPDASNEATTVSDDEDDEGTGSLSSTL